MYPDRVSRNLIIPTLSPPLILSTQNALVAALVAAVAVVALAVAAAVVALVASVTVIRMIPIVTLRPNQARLTLPRNKKMDLPVKETYYL